MTDKSDHYRKLWTEHLMRIRAWEKANPEEAQVRRMAGFERECRDRSQFEQDGKIYLGD